MTPLPILLAAVFLGTGNCSSKIVHGSSFLQSILKPLGRFKKKNLRLSTLRIVLGDLSLKIIDIL